jgi:hypothetical protein
MWDFGWLGSASLWKSGPLFSTGTKEAKLMVRSFGLNLPSPVARLAGLPRERSRRRGERGVGPRLSTTFAEQDSKSSPGLGILFPSQRSASGQGDMR